MIIERIVYCLVCIILFGYMVKKYKQSKSGMYLSIFAIQMVCIITQFIAFFSKIYVDIFMQLYILVFNILIPAGIFVAEYMDVDLDELIEIKLGDFFARRCMYDKAIEKYKKAISKNNNNAQVFAKLGRLYNAKGDRRTAFDRFARAIEIDRNDYRSYYEIGVIFNEMGKQADAQIVLDNSLRIKPDFTPASELLAVVLCAQNKYDEAINVYKNATRYDPDNYQLYYRMGVVRTELRDFNEAKECYERAIRLNPSLYEAYFSLGQINLLKGELEKAEEMFKKSLGSKDLTAKAYYQLAKVYILGDEEIKAVTYLGYAISIDPSYKYKAESEPLFARVKDYITGISMANDVMNYAETLEEEKAREYKSKADETLEKELSAEKAIDMHDVNKKVEKKVEEAETTLKEESKVKDELEKESNESNEKNENEKSEEKSYTSTSDDSIALDIFEKFKKLKKIEDEKAEKYRRIEKMKKLEELNREKAEAESNRLSSTIRNDEYYETDDPVVVRAAGSREGSVEEKVEKQIENSDNEARRVGGMINKSVAYTDNDSKEFYEDEDVEGEPHFDFMDRFRH